MSIANLWTSAFLLPSQCIKEIEQLCAVFLWTGPDLKHSGAKVAWPDICSLKRKGGLSIRPLKEVNVVHGLKIIWRLLSVKSSLWGKWVHMNLIKKKSFWEISGNTQQGSWMWRDISFLFDHWSEMGVSFRAVGQPRYH